MKLDNVFKKTRLASGRKGYISLNSARPEVPEGLLRKCNKCGSAIIAKDVKSDAYICPKCGGYFRVHAYRRIEMVADADTFEEWDAELMTQNPLEYKGYEEKISGLREKTGLNEAIVTGKAQIDGTDVVLGVCDGRFLMASMGEAVGEKIARAVERATKERLPVVLFACSGGARMQEGIVSLMQMAKTSAALRRHSDAGLLYISVLTDPTTGGVTASFAMLGDVILAEPKALIGFAGPRVIEQTIGQKLPKGFQRSEFLLEHGFIDGIVERPRLRETLSQILELHETGRKEQLSLPHKTGLEDAGERRHILAESREETCIAGCPLGAIPGGSLAHCSSSCEANTGSPSPRGRGVPSVGNCVGPSGGPGSWPRRLGCGQGGLVAQGPGLPEREERKAELWVLEEHQVGARGAPAEPRGSLEEWRTVSEASRSGRAERGCRRRASRRSEFAVLVLLARSPARKGQGGRARRLSALRCGVVRVLLVSVCRESCVEGGGLEGSTRLTDGNVLFQQLP